MTREIHAVMVGRPEYKIIGLIDRMETLEKTVKKHEKKIWQTTGVIIGVSICWEFIKEKLFGGK